MLQWEDTDISDLPPHMLYTPFKEAERVSTLWGQPKDSNILPAELWDTGEGRVVLVAGTGQPGSLAVTHALVMPLTQACMHSKISIGLEYNQSAGTEKFTLGIQSSNIQKRTQVQNI